MRAGTLGARLAVFVSIGCLAACATELPRAGSACAQVAQPERWFAAGTPDVGASPPLLSAHRGGVNLAPENTLAAYRHAFAYGMDFVEVDVRETRDGVLIAMHDETVDRTTDGSGRVDALTFREIATLNAADFEPWRGGEYDPVRVPRLTDVLELARVSRKGVELDIKEVRSLPRLIDLVASYGVLGRSYFNLSVEEANQAQSYNPEVRVIFNVEGNESTAELHAAAARSAVFGSRRERFSAEKIAAIHDGCAFVLPHSYDRTAEREADEFRAARAAGADGAQVNQPDVIANEARRRLPAVIEYRPATRRACLLNATNRLGLAHAILNVRRGRESLEPKRTDSDGCVEVPAMSGTYVFSHADTAAIRAATLTVRK